MVDNPLTSPRISANPVNAKGIPTAIQQAISNGTMSGNPVNVIGALPNSEPPQGGCSTGSQGGQGEALGAQNDNALGSGIDPDLKNAFNCARPQWEAANPGMKVYAFSGVADRPQNPNSKHPSGKAMDVAIYGTDGVMLNNLYNGDTPSYRAYESFAEAMGSCYQANTGQPANGNMRWGGNFGGTWYHDSMHFEIGGGPTSRGNVFANQANPALPNNSKPGSGIKYNGPTEGAKANAGDSQGQSLGAQNDNALNNTKNAVCSNSSTNGCAPISAGIMGMASSMLSGLGFGAPTDMLSAISNLTGSAGGLLQSNVLDAVKSAAGLASGGAGIGPAAGILSLTQSGLPNVKTFITKAISDTIGSLGSSTGLSSLTGVIPSQFSNINGTLTEKINESIDAVVKTGVPHLGGFPSVFNIASGAGSNATNLQKAVIGAQSQIFGKAGDGILGKDIPGFDLSTITSGLATGLEDEGIEAVGSVLESSWKPNIENSISLVKPIAEVLPLLVNAPKINGFSSAFKDYNSMVTQGFGNLTDNLPALGLDLYNLGRVGDLNDLLNIGTARQFARQLVENGLGITTGLLETLNQQGLTIVSVQNEESESLVFEILASITDYNVLEKVKEIMGIRIQLSSLADVLNPLIALPTSYEYNYFRNIQDMALTLAICGNGTGNLETLGDLGFLMLNMETAESFNDLNDEYHLVRYDELEALKVELPPVSKFNTGGPVIADFIGTAAGYIHINTFERMAELQEDIFASTWLDDFNALMVLLADTLNGNYSTSTVNPPTTAGHVYGSYSNLDAAILAIKADIEAELVYIKENAPAADPIFWEKLQEYQSLHDISAEYLSHEKKMRKAYGVEIGDPRRVTNYYGDGTSVAFPLESEITNSIIVTVNGSYKVQGVDFNLNAASDAIVFVTAPTIGQIISIVYSVGSENPTVLSGDTWQFASTIESYALQTGYGGPADFLNRLATDDMHGQRIKAVMIQARNKARFENVGIGCPGFNRILNDNDSKDFNFVERTGIWADNPGKAADVYLRLHQDVSSTEEYVVRRMAQNADVMKNDNDLLMQNVTRQLIFFKDNTIVLSQLAASLYGSSQFGGLFNPVRNDMELSYSANLPEDGYVLGDYREIISEICRNENMNNDNFNVELSATTKDYLSQISVDIAFLTSVVQRTLMVSLSSSLGITEDEARELFGLQSVSVNLLQNIANGN